MIRYGKYEQKIPPHITQAIQSLYNTVIHIKYMNEQTSEPVTTNQHVRQGCMLSPTVFNIYINKVTKEWKEVSAKKYIQLNTESTIKTILHADDQVLITNQKTNYKTH
jgi:hypothetical protein